MNPWSNLWAILARMSRAIPSEIWEEIPRGFFFQRLSLGLPQEFFLAFLCGFLQEFFQELLKEILQECPLGFLQKFLHKIHSKFSENSCRVSPGTPHVVLPIIPFVFFFQELFWDYLQKFMMGLLKLFLIRFIQQSLLYFFY